ncbi:hypothetical protein BH09VER1_BH09VER1_13670 [soil metagenome]
MTTQTNSLPPVPTHPIAVNVGEPERIASIVGGVLAAGAAVVQRSAATPFLFFTAGLLIYRGVTGRCCVYDKLHLNTAKATHPMDL